MIKIDEHFTLETAANNFTLKFEKATGNINKKSGKEEISKNEWYFPTLKQALTKYKNEAVKPCESIQEVWEKLDQVEKVIRGLSLKQVH